MPSDISCPSAELLRRSLDPDDPMAESERQCIAAHVERCARDCKKAIAALLGDDTWQRTPSDLTPREAARPAAPDQLVPEVPGYEILGEVGRGGMGVVYQARQLALNRAVALKMLLGASVAGADDLLRFQIEAEAVAELQHPNIVQIYEVGNYAGLPYFALEFVEGGTLAQKLRKKPLDSDEAAHLTETLARAVQHAHDHGILHRDLKPANVLLTADGSLKITDFGLARRLQGGNDLTKTGVIMGTPSYMAPELAEGRTRDLTTAVDVYALGAILYELLTGQPPFQGPTSLDTLFLVVQTEPVPPRQRQPNVPRDLEIICLKCLEKDPLRRYASAAELADDLRRFRSYEPIRARPVGPWQRAAKWARRRPGVAISLAIAVVSLIGGIVASTSFAIMANDRANQLERSRKDRAQAEVRALLNASPGAVAGILQSLRLDRDEVLPRLRELWDDPQLPERQRQRVALALLSVDPSLKDYLYDHLLDAEPDEVAVFVQQLSGYKRELTERLWAILGQPGKGHEDRRLRAAAALAAYDPQGQRWDDAAKSVVEQLVAVDPAYLAAWKEALRPVRGQLQESLAAVFRNRQTERAAERSLATSILADYDADQPTILAGLLLDADDKQFAALFPRVEANPEPVMALLTETVGKALDAEKTDDNKERLARQQANAAVALLHLGRAEVVWPLLKQTRDPRARSYLIHYLSPRGTYVGAVGQRLDEETDDSICRALLLILGEFAPERLTAEDRDRLLPRALRLYRENPDAGLHAAAGWMLRQWGQEDQLRDIDRVWAADAPQRQERLEFIRRRLSVPKRQGWIEGSWYVNGQGQTMVVIPGPLEFLMGSPKAEVDHYEDEVQHTRRIDRSFAIAAKPVTVEQYRQFDPGWPHSPLEAKYTRPADLPVMGIDWFTAAAYCNWLSKAEGIPEDQWCYEIRGRAVTLKAGYLTRTGYRLPTEAEMEAATRADTATARCYGETEELLPHYAWYQKNSKQQTWPVGSLKPNDWGLFDVHGNVYTWCQESSRDYPPRKGTEVIEDREDEAGEVGSHIRVLRGGSFRDQPWYVRSAARNAGTPTDKLPNIGLRPAKTFR